ncbi:MAG: hypothetical protein HWE20_04505 [Gammaproteobacteria bacterium]|nr:hypothetical protein [Gammaproteobacteria bacterium]
MSNICLITGNHLRHVFFAKQLISKGLVSSWVLEERENILPSAPTSIDDDLKSLFGHHFSERDRIENLVFGPSAADFECRAPRLQVERHALNDDATINFVAAHSPQLVISYGCHKLSPRFFQRLSARFWNVHGGLSPDYRGVATHFWPSYFLEPQMTGMTLHETTDFLDAGRIICQTAASMVAGDSLHRLAARTVTEFSEQLANKLTLLDFENLPEGLVQKAYGKVFMVKDWRPEHLRLIYEVYDDSLVDAVLNGEIEGRSPNLISVI